MPRNTASSRVPALFWYFLAAIVTLFGFSVVGGLQALGGDDSALVLRNWWELRLLRLLFAAAAGGALSVAGVAFQAVLRNPLAEPYILGISSGASVGVLSASWWWIGGATMAVPAFAGALGALGLLLGAVRWARVRDSATLILTGAVLNSIF